jgi:hypothetical protein
MGDGGDGVPKGMSEYVGCSVAVVTVMLSEGGDGVPKSVWGLVVMSCESLVVVVFEYCEQGRKIVEMWIWVRVSVFEVEGLECGRCWAVLRTRGRPGSW